jgi:hypothetical protein
MRQLLLAASHSRSCLEEEARCNKGGEEEMDDAEEDTDADEINQWQYP